MRPTCVWVCMNRVPLSRVLYTGVEVFHVADQVAVIFGGPFGRFSAVFSMDAIVFADFGDLSLR